MLNQPFEHLVEKATYRRYCPPYQTLSEYHADWLDGAEAQQIAVHVERCAQCQAKLSHLEAFLAIPDVVPKPMTDIIDITWRDALGYRWAKLKEGGQLLVQFLKEEQSTTFVPIAVRGEKSTSDDDILRHIKLTSQETDGADIQAIVRPHPQDGTLCTVSVQVQHRDKWPDYSGAHVALSANDWSSKAETDVNGNVQFTAVPHNAIDQLTITVDDIMD